MLEGSRTKHPQQYRQQLEKILTSVGVRASFAYRGTHFLVTKLSGDTIPADLYTPEIIAELRADVRANRKGNLARFRRLREGRTSELETLKNPQFKVWLDALLNAETIEMPPQPWVVEEFNDYLALQKIETEGFGHNLVITRCFLRYTDGRPLPPAVEAWRLANPGRSPLDEVRAFAAIKDKANSTTNDAS